MPVFVVDPFLHGWTVFGDWTRHGPVCRHGRWLEDGNGSGFC